jgi:hypothetical protein
MKKVEGLSKESLLISQFILIQQVEETCLSIWVERLIRQGPNPQEKVHGHFLKRFYGKGGLQKRTKVSKNSVQLMIICNSVLL